MAIYEAFGRGDVPSILDCLAEDVQWEYAWTESPVNVDCEAESGAVVRNLANSAIMLASEKSRVQRRK